MADRKVLPNDIELEQSLLGALIISKPALEATLSLIGSDLFYSAKHAAIYRALKSLYLSQDPINVSTVCTHFKKSEEHDYIQVLADAVITTSPSEAKRYIKILEETKRKREMVWALEESLHYLQDEHDEEEQEKSSTDISNDLQSKLFDLFNSQSKANGASNDNRMKALEAIEQACKRGGVIGVQSGYPSIDNILGGFGNSDLIILGGRPGMGKTSLAMGIAESIAKDSPILFVSLEMSATQLEMRRLASETAIGVSKMRQGNLNQQELQTLTQARITENFYIYDKPGATVEEIRVEARRLKSRVDIQAIFIDYLQLIQPTGAGYKHGTTFAITEISNKLKVIAKELDVPVICLSQLNRGVEQRQNKRPMMSDLRDSGSIEQDADSILFVYREEYYLEKEQPEKFDKETYDNFEKRQAEYHDKLNNSRGLAEVIVAKNRHGPSGSAKLGFVGETTTFKERD